MNSIALARSGERGVDLADVHAAVKRLQGRLLRTPTMHVPMQTPHGVREVVLKLEHTQLSGTFKARGILNTVLRAAEENRLPEQGIVIASGGNAGIAAAVAAQVVGVPATVAVPHDAPAAKLRRLCDLKADVKNGLADHVACNAWADFFAAETGALRLHAYDLPDVVSGAGTLLLEALEQEPDIAAVLVAVGGGGLIAGTALAAGGTGVRPVAVEPVGAPTLHSALAAGVPVDVQVDTILSDSLGATRIGKIAWEVCHATELQSVLVTDREIVAARELLWREYNLLVEGAGACALAAVTSGAWHIPDGVLPLVVLCGANVDDPFDGDAQTSSND